MTAAPLRAPPLSELTRPQVAWILGGATMTFATLPGQTAFIAQFNTALRTEFGLSSGQFGGLYTLATLASAATLVFAGALADRVGLRRLATAALLGLAAVALATSQARSVLALGAALALLRFFGQGMLSHVAMTAMARWFNRFRGRAISLASLGFTTGESLLPLGLTLAIASVGWRAVWAATAAALVVATVPLLLLLRTAPGGRAARAAGHVNPDATSAATVTGHGWTRARVLRDPLFLLMVPGIMGPPAIGTLFIFHQAQLVATKGWSLTLFVALIPVMAVTAALASLTSGAVVDRVGARRVMPVLLLPLAGACVVVAWLSAPWTIVALFLCLGLTNGMMGPVTGALWPELYGTAHLGAVRALVTAALVAASALGPGLAGALIDAGVDLEAQALAYAGWCLGWAGAYLALQPTLARRADGLA